ncbi:hypothetical protein [Bacillus toyonensis]|uniref:hypothetical protein n=1 Tax=Bacillus toyonensis TaxID=155322 RepID=UPI0027BA376D|nr:hypothetical protein [Bacillus toyonensis]
MVDINPVGPVDLVDPVGNVKGGIGRSVGPIKFGSNADPYRISCDSNSFFSDICHLPKYLS